MTSLKGMYNWKVQMDQNVAADIHGNVAKTVSNKN